MFGCMLQGSVLCLAVCCKVLCCVWLYVTRFCVVFSCVLQGSVLSSHSRLEDHVTLKECQVGARFTVTKEGK